MLYSSEIPIDTDGADILNTVFKAVRNKHMPRSFADFKFI